MRSSGETKVPDSGDEGERHDGEESSDTEDVRSAHTPLRPYPVWLKVEPSKRRFPPPPDRLSRGTWIRLSRQVAAFLRRRLNNTVTLRLLVRQVAAEIRLAGGSAEEVGLVLRRAVLEHPELATLDRINIVTRRLASEELLDRMLEWAREVSASEPLPGDG
jgi:hypothetical protein